MCAPTRRAELRLTPHEVEAGQQMLANDIKRALLDPEDPASQREIQKLRQELLTGRLADEQCA